MAIRLKNLDLNTTGMKPRNGVFLGDHTAANKFIFAAPVDCVVNYVDVYSKQANPPATTTASTTGVNLKVQMATATDTILGTRGTSATAVTTNSISANCLYRINCSANALTAGTPLNLVVSAQGSGALSQAIVFVTYTPLLHRGTR
jgi:hypothetical protein